MAAMKNLKFMIVFFAALLVENVTAAVRSNLIELPPGFSIEFYAQGVIYRIGYTQ